MGFTVWTTGLTSRRVGFTLELRCPKRASRKSSLLSENLRKEKAG